jgi:N-ethylmaleimide reductase
LVEIIRFHSRLSTPTMKVFAMPAASPFRRTSMNTLLTPLPIGRIAAANRVLMAPMTRSRADETGLVGPLTATYYAQRASAGLIITEGVWPDPMGKGYVRTPGLADARHAAAWREVTRAVQRAGGRVVAQLMHAGRISDPTLLPDAATPVAPSAIRPQGSTYTDQGPRPHVTPRALAQHEIVRIVDSFAAAARRAIDAGFDGVELHAGAGYLPMQFLATGSNRRTDAYGGSARRRVRFVVELLEALAAAVGADRVGLKVTPDMDFNDLIDDDPVATYETLMDAIAPLHLAFLEMAPGAGSALTHARMRTRFNGAYLAGVGFEPASAEALVRSGTADAVLFGKAFIANPDLPQRIARGAALAQPDATTFYSGGARGYVDYPPLEPTREAA